MHTTSPFLGGGWGGGASGVGGGGSEDDEPRSWNMFVKNRQRDGAGACRGFGDMGLADGDIGEGVGG